ncbi:hypothetical protein ABIC16_002906 [Sphingomonas sp. PvP055]|uniref:hypothetical protein n=1 Tax=Sphingomonas sp. PvP055 TaxID=3156391 RepID=UPI0033974E2C
MMSTVLPSPLGFPHATLMRSTRHPMLRLTFFSTGVVLVIASPVVGAIPGPGGIFVFAAGLALVLQNSLWAKKRFVHVKRRWPKVGHYADMGLRRRSAARRRARDRAID